ncbi:MAG: TrkA family potassium uptake protein [Lachnospiraceae bacterium]|nr:TrkA family potassium uptake protein [Lachnospiraceae bacterium]
MKKQCVVIGLGEFGTSVALTMADQGCDVLVIDKDEDRIEAIVDQVTHAVAGNATDPDMLNSLGIRNFDLAVITIGNNLEASIMATILVKESGVPYVLAKAHNDLHAEVLRRVGADEIVFPEKAMGVRIARNLLSGHFIDMIELSDQFSIVEVNTPAGWIGKNLMQLDLRKKGLNVIARKDGEVVETVLDPKKELTGQEVYIIFGSNDALQDVLQHAR